MNSHDCNLKPPGVKFRHVSVGTIWTLRTLDIGTVEELVKFCPYCGIDLDKEYEEARHELPH